MTFKDEWTSDCGTVRLICGDCLEVLPTLGDGIVDAVITDPPYSSGGAFRGDRMASSRAKYVSTDATHDLHAFTGDNRDQRSYLAWTSLWLCAASHIAAEGAICAVFTDWRQLPTTTDAIQSGGWVWRGLAVWQKPNARPMLGRFTNQAEYIPWGTNGPREIAGSVAAGWLVCDVPRGDRVHITEKPVEVMEWCLQPVPAASTVLDPFMGSGTTGVACVRTGRKFIGIELDAKYFEIAKRRISDELNRFPLLEKVESPQQLTLQGGADDPA